MTYTCSCRLCGKNFDSEKELDLDGDGKCPTCEDKAQKIAKEVDRKIAHNRASGQGMRVEKASRQGIYFEGGN